MCSLFQTDVGIKIITQTVPSIYCDAAKNGTRRTANHYERCMDGIDSSKSIDSTLHVTSNLLILMLNLNLVSHLFRFIRPTTIQSLPIRTMIPCNVMPVNLFNNIEHHFNGCEKPKYFI